MATKRNVWIDITEPGWSYQVSCVVEAIKHDLFPASELTIWTASDPTIPEILADALPEDKRPFLRDPDEQEKFPPMDWQQGIAGDLRDLMGSLRMGAPWRGKGAWK